MSPSELSRQGVVSPSILERDQVTETKHFEKEGNIFENQPNAIYEYFFCPKKVNKLNEKIFRLAPPWLTSPLLLCWEERPYAAR